MLIDSLNNFGQRAAAATTANTFYPLPNVIDLQPGYVQYPSSQQSIDLGDGRTLYCMFTFGDDWVGTGLSGFVLRAGVYSTAAVSSGTLTGSRRTLGENSLVFSGTDVPSSTRILQVTLDPGVEAHRYVGAGFTTSVAFDQTGETVGSVAAFITGAPFTSDMIYAEAHNWV